MKKPLSPVIHIPSNPFYLWRYLWIVFLSLPVFAQQPVLTPLQDSLARQYLYPMFGADAKKRIFTCNEVVRTPSGTFLNPTGSNVLFELTGDSLIRLDNTIYFGFNFGAYLFWWNGELYSLGGYGFYQTHNILQKFMAGVREWDALEFTGEAPEDIYNGTTYVVGDTLYTFSNARSRKSEGFTSRDPYIYKLHLKTRQWKKCGRLMHELYSKLPLNITPTSFSGIHLNDFTVDFQNNIVIHHLSHSYISFADLKLSDHTIDFDRCAVLMHNKNTLYNLMNSSATFNRQHSITIPINIDSLWTIYAAKAKPIIQPEERKTPSHNTAVIWAGVLFGLAGVYYFIRKKQLQEKRKTEITEEDRLEPNSHYIQILLQASKNELTTEELDRLLGIDHLTYDSQKRKRSAILKAVEAEKPGWLMRHRDSADKRKFIYRFHSTGKTEHEHS